MIALCFMILASLGADELPREWQLYFQRVEQLRAAGTKEVTDELAQLEEAIKTETGSKQRESLRKTRSDRLADLAELKRAKGFAFLPETPSTGDIGVLPKATFEAIDDDKARAHWRSKKVSSVIVTKTEVKKLRDDLVLDQIWRVVEPSASVKLVIKDAAVHPNRFVILEPIKKAELEMMRSLFEVRKGDLQPAARPQAGLKLGAAELEAAMPSFKFIEGPGPRGARQAVSEGIVIRFDVSSGAVDRIYLSLAEPKDQEQRARTLLQLFTFVTDSHERRTDLLMWIAFCMRMRSATIGTPERLKSEIVTVFQGVRYRSESLVGQTMNFVIEPASGEWGQFEPRQ